MLMLTPSSCDMQNFGVTLQSRARWFNLAVLG